MDNTMTVALQFRLYGLVLSIFYMENQHSDGRICQLGRGWAQIRE